MELPSSLRAAVEARAAALKPEQMRRISQQLTHRYHNESGHGRSLLSRDEEALVYSLVRMPATFAAVSHALSHALELLPFSPASLLDVGAGTGAAAWAAAQQLSLGSVTCFEREPAMRSLGQALMAESGTFPVSVRWVSGDLTTTPLPTHADLVIASYMLNEFAPAARAAALDKLWTAADELLVLLEPGSPEGFAILREARAHLLAQGAYPVAPCTHAGVCPNDWCHFSARVARSRLHKLLKEGDVPYEDEKFCYMVFSRQPFGLPAARILRHPQTSKGQIELSLCRADGISSAVIRKRDGEAFKAARKSEWGDTFSALLP